MVATGSCPSLWSCAGHADAGRRGPIEELTQDISDKELVQVAPIFAHVRGAANTDGRGRLGTGLHYSCLTGTGSRSRGRGGSWCNAHPQLYADVPMLAPYAGVHYEDDRHCDLLHDDV